MKASTSCSISRTSCELQITLSLRDSSRIPTWAPSTPRPCVRLPISLRRVRLHRSRSHGLRRAGGLFRRGVVARGCGSYRQVQLQEHLYKRLPDGELPEGWGLWLDERVVEYPWFLSRLPPAPGKLLDAGSVLNYDYVLCHERLNNKTISICTLAPESENYCHRG